MCTRPFLVMSLLIAMLLTLGTACGDNGNDDIGDTLRRTQETLENKLGQASAVTVAQAYRTALLAQDEDGSRRRETKVLDNAASQLPGDPGISGIEDADGDGRDDDGQVQVTVGDQSACVTVSASGDTGVDAQPCPRP